MNSTADEEKLRKRREKLEEWKRKKIQKLEHIPSPSSETTSPSNNITAGTAAAASSSSSSPTADKESNVDIKSLSVRERMELWRKQRELKKQTESGPSGPSTPTNTDDVELVDKPKKFASKPKFKPQKFTIGGGSKLSSLKKPLSGFKSTTSNNAGTKSKSSPNGVFGNSEYTNTQSTSNNRILGKRPHLQSRPDGPNEPSETNSADKPKGTSDEPEVDPLDMYMQDVSKEMQTLKQTPNKSSDNTSYKQTAGKQQKSGERDFDDDQDTFGGELPDDPDEVLA